MRIEFLAALAAGLSPLERLANEHHEIKRQRLADRAFDERAIPKQRGEDDHNSRRIGREIPISDLTSGS